MADQKPQPSTHLAVMNTFKALLDASKGAIASRVPRHLSADRILKVALTSINKSPKLLECTQSSVMAAVMQAAELGLEPGGALGEGYLVPYNNKVKGPGGVERWEHQCQFIPGYRGLIALARRSGEISTFYAEAVYAGDKFKVELGLDPKLEHTPDYDSEQRDDPKNITFTYSVARFKDGSFQFAVLSRKEIERIRKRSKAAESGPWVTDFEEMAKKTSVRRLSKSLPLSVEMAKALELQAAAEAGDFTMLDGAFELETGAETKALVESAPSKTDGVKAAVAGKAKELTEKKNVAETKAAEEKKPDPPTTAAEASTEPASDLFQQQQDQESEPAETDPAQTRQAPPPIDEKGW